jgi:hypothetical protein
MFSLFSLFSLLGSFHVSAATESTIQLGVYQSEITYTEPSVMEEDGSLKGIFGRYSYHEDEVFRALEIYYSNGDMNYDGSGTIDGIPDEMLEIRALVGKDFKLNSEYQISPYIGFGYRNLNDDSSGMVSSTSAYGYEREQIYLYIPIGIEFKKRSTVFGLMISGRVEYDYLIDGENHTYLRELGYEDVTLNQNDGYGYRVSIGLTREFSARYSVTLEPFYRYWNISDSEITYDNMRNGWIEPENYSKELGVSLLVTF